MKRRRFIRNISAAAGVPFALNGVPLKVMGQTHFNRLAANSDNENVLVILQLHGGNDGLNTIIPIEQYDLYYSRRANIAIPYKTGSRSLIELDSTLASADQVGLHPDMADIKEMYDYGDMAVVQGVSYPRNNGSHFRGRDIWAMGGGADDYYSSGWVGRYLAKEFEPQIYPDDFPTDEMPDPLALEMGNDVSLLFHQETSIPVSISLGSSPENLANLIAQLEGFEDQGVDPRGLPPSFLNGSPYGNEMDWILSLEDKSEIYIQRLLEVYQASSATTVDYPEVYPFGAQRRNPLSSQLQLVARLLDGGGAGQGVKTKVFLVKMGGFDTHAEQVESYDPTLGGHGALLYHISSAMKAFRQDLFNRGLGHKVMTVTWSEFGRRVASNGSYGTDHGTGGPVMMFGDGVNGGVFGTNPDVSQNNIEQQFDYRQIYANILKDWMGVDETVIENDIFYGNFINGTDENGDPYEPMELTKPIVSGADNFVSKRFRMEEPFPNPANNLTHVKFRINADDLVEIELLDTNGKRVKKITSKQYSPGEHTIKVDLTNQEAGFYFVSIKSKMLNDTKKLLVRK